MPRRQLWQRLGLAALHLVTGAALLAHIELGGSLPLTLAVALLVLGRTAYLAWRRLPVTGANVRVWRLPITSSQSPGAAAVRPGALSAEHS